MKIEQGKITAINHYQDWFIGSFVNEISHFNSKNSRDFEVKWSNKKRGDYFPLKEQANPDKTCNSLVLLISGRFKYSFALSESIKECVLEEPGDYIFWTPDLPHSIEALEDSITLTIRWYEN